MLIPTLGANWFIKTLALLFVWALDSLAYLLVSISYTIFYAVSGLNLFSTAEGAEIYTTISERIYLVLSIAMVFVFAYFIIMMIIDPDGSAGKTTSSLVKETVISLIAIVVLPTLFNWMSIFQEHVIKENTIGTIILGVNGSVGENPGKQISMIVFTAFYHPVGSSYSTFMKNDGTMKEKTIDGDELGAIEECEKNGASNKICQQYYDGLSEWASDPNKVAVTDLTSRKKLRHAIGDDNGMEYMWILSTGCAIAVAYFFFSYAIDLGTRAVKLGFLQLIAPVPLILRIFPTSKKNFDTWKSELIKTYLEVFLRLAVIFFIVLLCQSVPIFIDALWASNDNVPGGIVTKAIATVCLILGLLKFAKDAPALFKTLFASNGGLFAGMDWKPGMKRRIAENEYAMKGLSTGVGALGGMAGNIAMRAHQSYNNNPNAGNGLSNSVGAGFQAALAGLTAAPRGLISGGRKGFTNTPTELSGESIRNVANSGVDAAHASMVTAQNKHQDMRDNLSDPSAWANNKIADMTDNRNEFLGHMFGTGVGGQAALDTANKASTTIGNYMKLAESKTKSTSDAWTDLEKKLNKGEIVEFGGKKYSLAGGTYTETKPLDPKYRSTDAITGDIANLNAQKTEIGKKIAALDKEFANALNGSSKYTPKDIADKKSKLLEQNKAADASIANFQKELADTNEAIKNATVTQEYSTMKDLKSIFDQRKNEIIAEAVNGDFKAGATTTMANLNKQLSKELANLGQENINKINEKIVDCFKDSSNSELKKITNVQQLVKHMSDQNAVIDADTIAALGKVKSMLGNQASNIVIMEQQKAQQKQEDKK